MTVENEVAQQAVKTVTDYSLTTYLWVSLLSFWGGAVRVYQNIKKGDKFSFFELFGEMSISGFVGIITFWLCEYSGFSPLLTAALVGVSSHMGTVALAKFREFLMEKLKLTS